MNVLCMNREQQAKRRKEAYSFYKEISRANLNGEKRKEDLYKEVADKFGYSNIQSVKGLVSKLKKSEKADNEAKLNFALGIVETVLTVKGSDSMFVNFEELNFKYKLKLSDDGDDTVYITATYNSSFATIGEERTYSRKEAFDHFSISNLKSGINRISAFINECYQVLNTNSN